jgi:hypothetical protein
VNVDVQTANSSAAVRYEVTDTARFADDGTLAFATAEHSTTSTVIGTSFEQRYIEDFPSVRNCGVAYTRE